MLPQFRPPDLSGGHRLIALPGHFFYGSYGDAAGALKERFTPIIVDIRRKMPPGDAFYDWYRK